MYRIKWNRRKTPVFKANKQSTGGGAVDRSTTRSPGIIKTTRVVSLKRIEIIGKRIILHSATHKALDITSTPPSLTSRKSAPSEVGRVVLYGAGAATWPVDPAMIWHYNGHVWPHARYVSAAVTDDAGLRSSLMLTQWMRPR